MAVRHPALTVNDIERGTVVYERHPLTGEKYPDKRYTIVSFYGDQTDGETIVVADETGKETKTSSRFLCR